MPRLLQALKSIASGRAAKRVVEKPLSSSYSAAALDLFRDLASSVQHYIPDTIKSAVAACLGDKSQSEQIFLTSILLAVLLFVIILPAYETLFGCDGSDDKEDGLSGSLHGTSQSLRMYKPGVGVVEVDIKEIADKMLIRSSSCESMRSSSRSCGSNSSMETIEESEEEYLEDEEEESRGGNCRVETIEESEEEDLEDEEESRDGNCRDEVHSIVESNELEGVLFTEEEGVDEKVKYYEFLRFITSDKNPQLESSGSTSAELLDERGDGSPQEQDDDEATGNIPKSDNRQPILEEKPVSGTSKSSLEVRSELEDTLEKSSPSEL